MSQDTAGQLKALIEKIEGELEEARLLRIELSEQAAIMTVAAREIDRLRELSAEFGKIAKKASRGDWMRSGQLAKEMNMSRSTIWRYYQKGLIPGYQINPQGHVYFSLSEVCAALERSNDV